MYLPDTDAHYSQRVRYGRYLSRRLRFSKMDSLADDIDDVTGQVKQTGRDIEDALEPIQNFMADRDAFDATLDFAAQSARHDLAGRTLDAVKNEPYKSIFTKGIGYYIASPLGQQNARYQEFVSRLEANLASGDAVRVVTVKAVMEGLEGYNTAVKALDAARANQSMLSTKLTAAVEAWNRQVEKTYGALVSEVGRTRAELFFPKASARRARKTEAPEEDFDMDPTA